MNTNCSTGKRSYASSLQAEDALIFLHAKNRYPDNHGPNGYYQCDICGWYHLTSNSLSGSVLDSPEVKEKIRKMRVSLDWESKLR